MIQWFKNRFNKGRGNYDRQDICMSEALDASGSSLHDSEDSNDYSKLMGSIPTAKSYNTTLNIVFYRLEEVMKKEKPYLDRNFSLEKLASRAGTNRTYASNAINNIAGYSFSKYVNGYRLDYAAEILNDSGTEIQVENLSALCGYKDIRSFLIALYDTKGGAYKSLKNKYLCGGRVKKQKYYL